MNTFFSTISDKLATVFDPQTIADLLAEGIINILVAILVFLSFFVLWKVVSLVLQPLFKKAKLDKTTSVFTHSIIKYAILTFGVVTALDSVGIKTSALLTSLGIVGLTIGFAARDSLSNLISGVIIFLDRPFVIGDLVEIDGKYGQVDRITLRSTRIVTVDGKMLAVPNVDVINKTVTSYTNFPHLRVDVQVSIGVNEDIDKTRKILLGLVQNKDAFMSDPAPSVVIRELNDYNVLLELRAWIHEERDHLSTRFKLREDVFKALNAANIVMPFETIQLEPVTIHSS